MVFTILVSFMFLGGFFGPANIPDGKGGIVTYTRVGHISHCKNYAIKTPDGKGGLTYFCKV